MGEIQKIPNTNQIVPSATLNNNFSVLDTRLKTIEESNYVTDPNYVATDNNFTDALKTKLDGIETGAQVNTNVYSEIYLGDPATNGSWRFKVVDGKLRAQLRVAGVWTNKGGFTP